MLDKIEGLGHIHEASIDTRTVPQKVVDGLDSTPGTHTRRTSWLVSKLEFVDTKTIAKQNKNHPIEEFQNKTAHGNGPVVFAIVYTTELILD